MRKTVILMLIIFIGNRLYAQNRVICGEVKYTTELQSNFQKSYNWVNLLDLSVQLSTEAMSMWHHGFLDMEVMSIYRTVKERILDDKQVFSNIDEENQSLRIFTLGYTHEIGRTNLFVGLRNVNRDYFTTRYTSLFTNSSCGIYPTISANYPLANYPLSGMCLHAECNVDNNWSIRSSLYNGTAYESFKQAFTIRPERDGIFNITQISYTLNSTYNGIYHLGSALHSRMPMRHENGEGQFNEKTTSQEKTKVDYSLWADIEQCIYSNNEREIGILAQCSFAPSDANLCSQYYGIGLHFSGWTTHSRKDQLGFFIHQSKYDSEKETSLELTWKLQLTNNLEIQPALHLIKSKGNVMAGGLFRFSYMFNFK